MHTNVRNVRSIRTQIMKRRGIVLLYVTVDVGKIYRVINVNNTYMYVCMGKYVCNKERGACKSFFQIGKIYFGIAYSHFQNPIELDYPAISQLSFM